VGNLCPNGATSECPGLPRSAATLGSNCGGGSTPTGLRPTVPIKRISQSITLIRLTTVLETDTTPLGLGIVKLFFPG
jgi:hypothetical protein